ncbi:MAG: hydrolase [Nitrospirae bacterium]|nr:hydrolase [Nitrospirota bacterium]MBI5694616.1 hydrolase [Nitrospirota bacterium]
MPFTPFHFGPAACLSLPLRKRIDVPVFILANVVVDLEPLTVMTFGLDYPLHGYVHTLMFGGLIGALFGAGAFSLRTQLIKLMGLFALPYRPSIGGMILSGVLGIWFHILLDSPLYADIRPLYPLTYNPVYGLVSGSTVYVFCAVSFVPAIMIYLLSRAGTSNK